MEKKETAMDKITLSIGIVNQVMGYLGTRPYQEVFQIVEGLQAEAKAQAPAPADTSSTSTPEA
jgi:hypothetical protein